MYDIYDFLSYSLVSPNMVCCSVYTLCELHLSENINQKARIQILLNLGAKMVNEWNKWIDKFGSKLFVYFPVIPNTVCYTIAHWPLGCRIKTPTMGCSWS